MTSHAILQGDLLRVERQEERAVDVSSWGQQQRRVSAHGHRGREAGTITLTTQRGKVAATLTYCVTSADGLCSSCVPAVVGSTAKCGCSLSTNSLNAPFVFAAATPVTESNCAAPHVETVKHVHAEATAAQQLATEQLSPQRHTCS
jgi:hypothetical protein